MAIGKFSGGVPGSATLPKVSVLMPAYNHAPFLGEAVTSVLDQDFSEFELVISDDCSSDGSADVITTFAKRDPRIKFTIQPSNLGIVANFNWCLSQARGEYIKFLFDDDKLARRDTLSRLVGILEQDRRVVLASSSAVVINQNSEVEFVRDYLHRDRLEAGVKTCRRCLLSGVNQIGEPSLFLFRRSCAGSGFNPGYRHWVDVEFAIRILQQGWFAYSAEPLACFRFHARQQSRADHVGHLHQTEFYRLLVECAELPWLGKKAARERLFEESYRIQKRPELARAIEPALNQALNQLGREGYGSFMLMRRLLGPLKYLRGSLGKRLYGHGT